MIARCAAARNIPQRAQGALRPLTKPQPPDAASFAALDLTYSYIGLCKTAPRRRAYERNLQICAAIIATRTETSACEQLCQQTERSPGALRCFCRKRCVEGYHCCGRRTGARAAWAWTILFRAQWLIPANCTPAPVMRATACDAACARMRLSL